MLLPTWPYVTPSVITIIKCRYLALAFYHGISLIAFWASPLPPTPCFSTPRARARPFGHHALPRRLQRPWTQRPLWLLRLPSNSSRLSNASAAPSPVPPQPPLWLNSATRLSPPPSRWTRRPPPYTPPMPSAASSSRGRLACSSPPLLLRSASALSPLLSTRSAHRPPPWSSRPLTSVHTYI